MRAGKLERHCTASITSISMPRVRRIRPGDGPRLRELRLRALRLDPDAFGSSYEREVAQPADGWERWAVESSTGGEVFLVVAESDGTFVGMAGGYTPSDEPLARRLFGMWVAPEARSAGIGFELTESVIGWSSEGGAEVLHLWVVESNRVARRLYERAGFVETGVFQQLPSNPSLTEIQMSLQLHRNGGFISGES